MRQLVAMVVLGALLLLAACASVPVEAVISDMDATGWTIGYQRDAGPGRGYIREWVPKGEHIEKWSRLLSIEFREGERQSALTYATELGKLRQEQCPGTQWALIENDDYSAIYSVAFPPCAGHDAQVELTRLIMGNDGLHRFSYAEKGRAFDADTAAHWLGVLRKAYVAKGSPENRIR